MESNDWCPWISCFNNNTNDPFHMFKDVISLDLEEQITKVANQLEKDIPEVARKDAQNIAINMIMERLLILQKEHTPQSQKSMIINLFSYLPEMKDFRHQFIKETKEQNSLFNKMKKIFKTNKKGHNRVDYSKF